MRDLRKQVGAIRVKARTGAKLPEAHSAWQLLVEDYSRRNLTKDSDKLVALAGIINSLSEAKSDTCYAGIWNKYIRSDLSWFVITKTTVLKHAHREELPRGGPKGQRLASSIAPSWSWASVNGHVCFLDSSHAEQYELSLGPKHPQTGHHVIIATAPLARVKNCVCGGTCDAEYIKTENEDVFHYSLEHKIDHLLDISSKRRVADWFPDTGDFHTVVWCLPIGEHLGSIICLALALVDGYGENYYQRIGLAIWPWNHWKRCCSTDPAIPTIHIV
jgi:hypothetical protein